MQESKYSPRPSSLRALAASFFVLSFKHYPDSLQFEAHKDTTGKKLKSVNKSIFKYRMKQLLWWPPDIFALTSAVLARTGAYRMVVGPDGKIGKDLWQQLDWQSRVSAHGEAWRSAISGLLLDCNPIPNRLKKLLDDEDEIDNVDKILQRRADKRLSESIDARIEDRCRRRHLEKLTFNSSKLIGENCNAPR